MQNPLEHFLADLANKIQTAKEYKEIVKDSQNVDVNKNVFEGFITGVAETIKKELKERATVVPVSAVEVNPEQNQEEDSFVKFVSTLANTISASKNKPIKQKSTEEKPVETQEPKPSEENEETPKQTETPQQDSFDKFLGNLKDILQKTPQEKPKEKQNKEKGIKQKDYVQELKKDAEPNKPKSKDDLIRDLVRKFVEGEIKNFKDEVSLKISQVGSAYGGGGGTNAVQYAKGGTMDGDLNVTGHYLSAGVDLLNIFTGGGGGGGGDPAVNSVVYSNSANWNSTYSTVNSYSATWSTGLQDLAFDENTALLSITNGNTVSLSALSGGGGGGGDPAVNNVVYSNSASWISNYTTSNYFSAFWNAAVDELFTFYVTQTSAASAFWAEDGNYYFIQNSKLDNVPLWNNMYTTLYLNSAGWESTETTVRTASANWNSTYSSLSPNSAKYDSVYTTYNQNSASYATEILAIAYAVAL